MEKKKTKRFYWMKLTEDFMFSKNGPLDFLMTSSPNGAKYVVLYQMLCLQTINTGGVFVTDYGDIVVKLTIAKIKQECKYFSEEEIVVALELYKKIGLVAEDKNGLLEIKGHENLIGSEGASASRTRRWRLKEEAKSLEEATENVRHIECHNVTSRDKDTRYTDITVSNNKEIKSGSSCSNNISEIVTNSVTDLSQDNNDNDDDFPSPLKEFKGKIGEGVLLTDEQFDLLCEKLSMEELDLYLAKMSNMVKKGYQFGCSHYKFILKMVEEDRRT